jgi:hypothetical protein
MTIRINLESISGRYFIGKPNGQKAREKKNLDQLDIDGIDEIVVDFPDNIKAITSSFFIGLFGSSIIKSGSKQVFMKRLKLNNINDIQKKSIEEAIEHVILTQNANVF